MKTKLSQGFTLIELLVAIGIFVIFITIITGIFTNFIKVQRHAIAQGQLLSDMTSALEAFIKEARTGYGSTYLVFNNGKTITFVNQNRNCVAYRILNNTFQRADIGEQPDCTMGKFTDGRFTPITSNATKITDVHFDITRAEKDRSVPPRLMNQGVITITLTAKSKKDSVPPISIQNSVTSRQMEPL